MDASSAGRSGRKRSGSDAAESRANASHGDSCLGGNVCHIPEPASRWTARRRTHSFFYRAAGPQIRFTDDHSDSVAHGLLPLGRLVRLGHSFAVEQLSASASRGVAQGFRSESVAGSISAGNAGAHTDPSAVCPCLAAGGGKAVSVTMSEARSSEAPRKHSLPPLSNAVNPFFHLFSIVLILFFA